ncbi:TPA: DNA-binding response regulator [Streptococcus suis]|nr:DNA-binding response regulator [Streptococcus suis]
MNIIVLDDNIHHQLRLESALYDVARSLHIHINIECARTIQALREYMNQEDVNQIYFLDLEIGNQKNLGFEIAKEIRNNNPYAVIIFVTSYSDLMPLVFQYHLSALDFIIKDLKETEFRNRLKQCLEQVIISFKKKSDGELLRYSYQNRTGICIPFSDILFIQTSVKPHRLIIYTVDFIKEFYGTLNDILDLDSKNYFEKVDRSTTINVYNVTEYSSKTREVKFFEGTTCLVSRLRIKDVKTRLRNKGII